MNYTRKKLIGQAWQLTSTIVVGNMKSWWTTHKVT